MIERLTSSFNPEGEKYNPRQRLFLDTVLGVMSRSQRLEILKDKIKKYPSDGDPDQLQGIVNMADDLQQLITDDPRFFFYGGGVSGGKSTVAMSLLCIFAGVLFKNSRWHIVRESMTSIEQNVVPSLNEVLRYSEGLYWKKSKSDYFVQFPNGSRISLIGENYDRDKDLNKFKGLQSNGFLLEQIEELQEATFDKCIERAGRWYQAEGFPKPIVMATFNPTYGWLKEKIHDKHKTGELKKSYYYLQALPKDSPWNTEEQWAGWENMDPDAYARFIEGKWDIEIKNQFFNWFDEKKNVSKEALTIDYGQYIVLSFDFNVDPMTAILAQTDGHTWAKVIKEFRIDNSDTYGLCDLIKPVISGLEHLVVVTGDASGNNRMSGTRGHINHYQIIMIELGLRVEQFQVPKQNPFISDSRVFMNSLFYKLPSFLIDPSCEYLIRDLKFLETEIDQNGKVGIKKSGVSKMLSIDSKELGHQSDNLRYFAHTMLYDWFKFPKS